MNRDAPESQRVVAVEANMSERNPYEAPKAPLRDEEPDAAPRRPWSIWVATCLGGFVSIVIVSYSLVFGLRLARSGKPTGVAVLVILGMLAILVLMLHVQAFRGRNWARIGSAIWLGVLIAVSLNTSAVTKATSWELVGALIPVALMLTSVVLLFLPVSNAWIRAKRS